MPSLDHPRLPRCFLSWGEPPDSVGDERLRIVSRRRSLTLKGHSFREFAHEVLPLLDGQTHIDDIGARVAHLFDPADLAAALETLSAHGIVVEGGASTAARLEAQQGYFDEFGDSSDTTARRLRDAHVVLVGAGGAGGAVARALGVAGVGRLVCIDASEVGPVDTYFSSMFGTHDIGRSRAEVMLERVREVVPDIDGRAVTERPADADAFAPLVADADLVLCCLESGDLNLALKLARACRAASVRWLAGALEGPEIVAGPGFGPDGEGPCYLCYRMREVACAANPESRFALERRLDRLQRDLGARRENLVCGADLLAGLLVAETLNILGGSAPPSLDGKLLVSDLRTLGQTRHTVLKKPGCPVCGRSSPEGAA